MGGVDEVELRKLDDSVFRERLLRCNVCFDGRPNAHCRHHEDAVSGWRNGKRLTGRIVVVGVNPQGRADDEVYSSIEQSERWEARRSLSDSILEIYAGRAAVEPSWGWEPGQHRGLKTWFPRVQKVLGIRDAANLADHFTFVELIKHTTADEKELATLCRTNDAIHRECPKWLLEQLRRLHPRLVIVTGNRGKSYVLPQLYRAIPGSITKLHGSSYGVQRDKLDFDLYLSVAFSSSSNGAWQKVMSNSTTAERHLAMLARIQQVIADREKEAGG